MSLSNNNKLIVSLTLWVLGIFALVFVYAVLVSRMDLTVFMQHIVNGVSLGSLFALIAIGYTMVYTILNMINFAHGDIFMMSLYFSFFTISVFHLPWFLALLCVLVLTPALGLAIERLAYRPLRDAPKNSVLISAIGVSFLLENLATYLFSGRPKTFPDIPLFTASISVAEVKIQVVSIVIPVITVLALVALINFINHTKTGTAMRAVAQDYEIARVMGININGIISLTFIIGSMLAAVGGFLWGLKYPGITPMMGVMPGLKCFIAAVVGGIGNINGAVLGGFILGMGEVLIVALFPELSGFRDAFAFILLIIILLVKPSGLLGSTVAEKV